MNKCYREEYVKAFSKFTLPKAKTDEMEAATKGAEATIMIFKIKRFLLTKSILEMKKTLINTARMGDFEEVKFIGSDGEVAIFSVDQ